MAHPRRHRVQRDQQAARSMVPVRTAVPVRAVVRKQIVGTFGSPTVPSGRAIRRLRPCRPLVPASGAGGSAGCWVKIEGNTRKGPRR